MRVFARPNLLNDYHLLSYEELDSTNEEARRIAEGGGSHGAVIWAKRQMAGRGRMGRTWISHEGNLFCSFLLEPNCDLETAAQLSFVAAAAAVETLKPIVDEECDIACKWPNDIMLNGKKVGGILLESFETSDIQPGQNRMIRWIVIGIGINIDSCPQETSIPATYLKEAGVEIISAKIVLSRFIHHFITEYDIWAKKGFVPIRKKWMQYAFKEGELIEVRLPNETHVGVFEGINPSGHLQLKQANGQRITLSAGDVFW